MACTNSLASDLAKKRFAYEWAINSDYQSHAPSNAVFSRFKIEFSWTSIICFHDNSFRRGSWEAGQFVSKMAFHRPFQRFLADFAYSSNTLEEESQE